MEIKYKIIDENIKGPEYSREGDACFDLFCREIIKKPEYIEYKLNTKFEIPYGFVGLIYPRSSITEKNLMMKNSIGIIDPNFRGEVTMRCIVTNCFDTKKKLFEIGEKCAQMRIAINPKIKLIKTNKLSETNRGELGYGSSGR